MSEIEVYGGENNGTLTVQNGTGGGTFSVGKITPIKATSPGADYEFKGWTIVSGKGYIANPAAESTTFTVAAGATTIKANYELTATIMPKDPTTVKVEAGIVNGIGDNKTAAQVKAMFKYDVTIKAPDGTVTSDAGFVGTGYTISAGSETVEVVITGDLNSDASVSSSDFIVLKKFLSGKVTLTGAFEKASDCDVSGAVSSADYISLAAQLKG